MWFNSDTAISTLGRGNLVDEVVPLMLSFIKADAVDCVHLYGKWSGQVIKRLTERFEFAEVAFDDDDQYDSVLRMTRDCLPMPVACTPQMIIIRHPDDKFIDALRSMGKRFDETRFVIVEHHYLDELNDIEEYLSGHGFYLKEITGGTDIFVATLYHRAIAPGA